MNAHFPLFGAAIMTFKRITFEAALAYARGKMEQNRDIRLSIQLILDDLGIRILATSTKGKREHIVTWHDLEYAQYDALRPAIDVVSDPAS